MIEYHYLTDYELDNTNSYTDWLGRLTAGEGKEPVGITFVFADDEYVRDLNRQFLDHDYYTDILTFDNSAGNQLEGDIYISVDRVRENAETFMEPFQMELLRVMAHGVLHMMGYKDKEEEEIEAMRAKEVEAIAMFHVEQIGN